MSFLQPLRRLAAHAAIFKLSAAAILIALLHIPLGSIESLVEERNTRRLDVVQEIAEQWGAGMTFRGPFLAVRSRADGDYRADRAAALETLKAFADVL